MPPRKGGATKANPKTASAIGPEHVLNNSAPRGATSTRGGRRKRTSNNVANDNYSGAAETVVAANPFDDDNSHHIHQQLHLQNQHQQNHNQYQYQQQSHMQQHHQQHIYHQPTTNMNHATHHHMGQQQHSVQHGNIQHQQAPNMANRQMVNNHDPNGTVMQGHPQHQMQHQIAPVHMHPQQHQQIGGPNRPPSQQINQHHPNNLQQHHQQQQAPSIQNLPSGPMSHPQGPPQNMYNPQSTSTSPKMLVAQAPQEQQHFQHQQQSHGVPHQVMHSAYANPDYMHHPQATPPNNQGPPPLAQQPPMSIQQPPIIHQSHPHNMSTPPTQMIPAGQSPIVAPDNVNSPHLTSGGSINVNGPPPRATHHQHQMSMQNQGGQIMTTTPGGISQANAFGPPHPQLQQQQQQQQQQVTSHLPQNQMIGTSTPPHMINSAPAPSQSPYMKQQGQPVVAQPPPHPQQQGQMHAGPMAQSMTPQPPPMNQAPHLAATNDQMLMHSQQQQDQSYGVNQGLYCGKCQREIYQNELNIICKARCQASFHVICSGLTDHACHLLMTERLAEWICDGCSSGGVVPYVKYKP